jgi:hypothetical protein
MGYELELKVKFVGLNKYDGAECAIRLNEFCDDGSDPETKVYVTKEKNKDQSKNLKSEI